MRNIIYQTKKKARAEINLRSIVPQEYYNFLDVFSKKNLDTFLPYQKYNHKIHLKEKQKPSHILLYKIFPKELDAIKRYLNFYLAKRFI